MLESVGKSQIWDGEFLFVVGKPGTRAVVSPACGKGVVAFIYR